MKDNFTNAIMLIVNLLVLGKFVSTGNLLHGIGYFIFFYTSIFVIKHLSKRPVQRHEIQIKKPRQEIILFLSFICIGIIFTILKFHLKENENTSEALNLAVSVGMLLFTVPIAIAIYLIIKKYKLNQIGFQIKPFTIILIGVIIWLLTGIFATTFNKTGIIWEEGLKELGGVSGLIIQGVIGAALVEEFTRFVLQSRIQSASEIRGIGILIATMIWAFMHFPMSIYKTNNWLNSVLYCFQIIPLGYIWGYMIHRTKSIIPSVFAHGLNLWGFQNG